MVPENTTASCGIKLKARDRSACVPRWRQSWLSSNTRLDCSGSVVRSSAVMILDLPAPVLPTTPILSPA